MNRTLNVVRMQLINRQAFIWIPLIILGSAFAISMLVFAFIPDDVLKVGGGSAAPLWYFLAAGAMSMAYTFPFAQAMSITRREFFLGTLLAAMLTATMLAAISLVGGWIEFATDGWGMSAWFFTFPEATSFNVLGQVVFTFGVAMLFFVVGFWSATIFKRFGALWVTVIWVGIGLIFFTAVGLVYRFEIWPHVARWFGAQTTLSVGLWLLLVAAGLGGISYLALRRTTP